MPKRTSGFDAALAEASDPSWVRRARAGRVLAAFADVPEAADALVRLLLDAEDTAVTPETARALAGTGTKAAAGLVALAFAEAGDDQADWLATGVHDALVDGGPEVAAVCGQLVEDREEAVRRGA
ncbi:hypothetical protein ACGFRB_25955 [Streptomyces sp. NPDC048718]|uniref:hypothetical protein n=1 Tax=Streptomyces sp. NPDC048718 TaxID=3365587 RepID=UPI00371A1C97